MATRQGTLALVTYKGAPYIDILVKNHSDAEPSFESLYASLTTKSMHEITLTIGVEYTIKWDYYLLDETTVVPLDPPTSLNNTLNFVTPAL